MIEQETIRTVIWAVMFLFALQAFSFYAIVRLVVTGRAMFERREQQPDRERIVRPGFGSER